MGYGQYGLWTKVNFFFFFSSPWGRGFIGLYLSPSLPAPPVPFPARTMTALNCLLAAGLTVLDYRLVILSKETAAQRSGLLQIKQAVDLL